MEGVDIKISGVTYRKIQRWNWGAKSIVANFKWVQEQDKSLKVDQNVGYTDIQGMTLERNILTNMWYKWLRYENMDDECITTQTIGKV